MGQKRGGGMEGRVRRRVVGSGVAAPGAYWRRRRACRGPRSLRLWPGGGGRKARRGVGAIAEPWVGVDSSKPPGLARHAGATIGRGGGSLHSWRAAGLPLRSDPWARWREFHTSSKASARTCRRREYLLTPRVQGWQNCTHATCFGGFFERK